MEHTELFGREEKAHLLLHSNHSEGILALTHKGSKTNLGKPYSTKNKQTNQKLLCITAEHQSLKILQDNFSEC